MKTENKRYKSPSFPIGNNSAIKCDISPSYSRSVIIGDRKHLVVFSGHARERMLKRKIDVEHIIDLVKKIPASLLQCENMNLSDRVGNRLLRIGVSKTEKKVVVKTAYWKCYAGRRAKGE